MLLWLWSLVCFSDNKTTQIPRIRGKHEAFAMLNSLPLPLPIVLCSNKFPVGNAKS